MSPMYIGFATSAEAFAHRKLKGGWVFVTTDESHAIWFDFRMTPSKIFNHPIQRGLSGKLH